MKNQQAIQFLDYPTRGTLGRGLDVKASRACQLAETLAWAVTSGIPLPNALRSLPFYRPHKPATLDLLIWIAWLLTPTFYWIYIPWLNDLRWSARINRVIADLEKGLELGPTLQWWLGRFVPDFYLQGLMRAESENRLETALPILSEQMAYPLTVTRRRFMSLLSSVVQIMVLAWVLLFLLVYIAPRFQEILEEVADVTFWLPTFPQTAVTYLGLLLSAGTIWVAGFTVLPYLGRWGEMLSQRIPWVGPNRRRFLTLDLARSLCVYLRQGDDLLTAAIWVERSTPNHWLKRRLNRFIAALRAGEDWLDAWEKARLGKSLERWALRNAAAREDPAAGFELIAEWTHQKIETTTSRIERWVAPISALVLGACIGAVGISFFHGVVTIIELYL